MRRLHFPEALWTSGASRSYEPDCRLRLFAEMKVPGRAWLEFRVKPEGTSTIIQQIAQFEPRGLTGMLYWYLLSPIHEIMFRAMLRRIAAAVLHPLVPVRGMKIHSALA